MCDMEDYLLKDKELGTVSIRVNSRARRIIMRPSADRLHVTVPPGTSRSFLLKTLREHRERLTAMQKKQAQQQRVVDFDYHIDTDLLHLWLTPGRRQGFYVNRSKGKCEIVCPSGTNFEICQDWLHGVVAEQLRIQAKAILPERLRELASKYGLNYESVRIQSSRTRWGSCSGHNNINLSLFLMKLPTPLVDYVLLHELCHTVHHDHSADFWALMDSVTNHKALSLRRELQAYHTEI